MSNVETAPPSDQERLLWTLTACIGVVGVAVVCFNLLYLFVPPGQTPSYGFAPDIAAAYARTIPLPAFVFSSRTFKAISLALQAAMWGAFFMAILAARKLGDGASERAAFKRIAVGGAVVSLALILTPPTLSKDLYHYALFGRMIITRGLNP